MRKLYTVIIMVLLMAVLSACQVNSVNENVKWEKSDKKKNVVSSSTTPLSEYPGIDIESILMEGDEFVYSVHMPKIEGAAWNQEMDLWIGKEIDDFAREAKGMSQPDQKRPPELHIDFEIYSASEKSISVKFESFVFREGEPLQVETSTYSFDRENEEFLTLSHLFKDDSSYLERLSELSFQKLMKNPKIKEQLTEEHVRQSLEPTVENFKHFFIKDEKLIVLFEAGRIGPHSIGDLEIELTKDELKDILKQETVLGIVEEVEEAKEPKEPVEKEEKDSKDDAAVVDPNKKYVALSFDDGPHKSVTPRILDILAKYDAHATFFVLGTQAEAYPEILKRAVSEGHEIGNHSWSHPYLSKLSQGQIKEQLRKTDELVAGATGVAPGLVRPPYGEVNEAIKASINKPIIKWSVDTRDWESRNPNAIMAKVQSQVKDGAIILMHDTYSTTAESLDRVLKWLYEEGYEVVTVSELLGFSTNPEIAIAGKVYSAQEPKNSSMNVALDEKSSKK